MSELPQERVNDRFAAMMAELGDAFNGTRYNELDGCYELALDDDLDTLRAAFRAHQNALRTAGADVRLSPDELQYLEYIMNKTDLWHLEELQVGNKVSSASGVTMVYHDEAADRMAYLVLAPEERVVGNYQMVSALQVPSLTMQLDRATDGTLNDEPVLVLVDPYVETVDGIRHELGLPAVLVPFLESSIKFTKGMHQEPVL